MSVAPLAICAARVAIGPDQDSAYSERPSTPKQSVVCGDIRPAVLESAGNVKPIQFSTPSRVSVRYSNSVNAGSAVAASASARMAGGRSRWLRLKRLPRISARPSSMNESADDGTITRQPGTRLFASVTSNSQPASTMPPTRVTMMPVTRGGAGMSHDVTAEPGCRSSVP